MKARGFGECTIQSTIKSTHTHNKMSICMMVYKTTTNVRIFYICVCLRRHVRLKCIALKILLFRVCKAHTYRAPRVYTGDERRHFSFSRDAKAHTRTLYTICIYFTYMYIVCMVDELFYYFLYVI